ncbi:membrane protein [Pontibacillus halophilus JSM 076056 = DSM 19796]|uniref:Membrane protein n=1 Tax=Pontibacillus halophilus JSM 076056 = DSM 19796 TaxID=1385510 RepID=A0A0A5GKK2_9BACI|nr:putative sulfate exporter family transporter [Pontibacillus halophilus]KGX93816.1 membrane protein [Pontibacillus halophilus JSM 076056 = DSM 19796]
MTQQQSWWGGIGFTFLIALLGVLLSLIPGFAQIGSLASAILIAVLYRQKWGYPEPLKSGITFSTKKLLRVAIILYGLKLNLSVVMNEGIGLLAKDAFSIILAIVVTMLIARWLKANWTISMLLAVGTGVCGAAAIAAVSPILKAKEEDTALSVGIIALVGTIFGIGYTIVRPFLPLDAEAYGIWAGLSLHEIAHVALAGAPAGDDGLAMALLAKLGRVLLLIPLSFLLVFYMRKKEGNQGEASIVFPWFLLGFVAMSFVGTYVIGPVLTVPTSILEGIDYTTTFLLAMAMSGLGLNVDLSSIKSKTARPLTAMLVASVVLTVVTYVML